MNYDEMPAGSEMDRLVAERVMGWTRDAINATKITDEWEWTDRKGVYRRDTCGACGYDGIGEYFQPSNNIAHAWEVVEKMASKWRVSVDAQSEGNWCVWYVDRSTYPHGKAFATGETAPLAVCRAALKAIRAP